MFSMKYLIRYLCNRFQVRCIFKYGTTDTKNISSAQLFCFVVVVAQSVIRFDLAFIFSVLPLSIDLFISGKNKLTISLSRNTIETQSYNKNELHKIRRNDNIVLLFFHFFVLHFLFRLVLCWFSCIDICFFPSPIHHFVIALYAI